MISPESIEESQELLSNEEAIERAMLDLATEQTAYLQYFETEGFELLSDEERDYLKYLALVIYGAVKLEDDRKPEMISGERLEYWEERCWEWLEGTVGKPMALRLDVFFANIDQEELLAFAEDSLVDPDPDEEEEGAQLFASGPSRELGFVALAVFIAALDEWLLS